MQKPEVPVVDHLVLLPLAQGLDGQPDLLVLLVHRIIEQVGDAGMEPEHGLGHVQLVLTGRQLVVDEGLRQPRLAGVASGQLDGGLPRLVLGLLQARLEILDVREQRRGLLNQILEHLLRQDQHRARRHRLDGEFPEVIRLHHRLIPEVVSIGQHVEGDRITILTLPQLLGLAVGQQVHVVRGLACLDDELARLVLPLNEPAGEGSEQRVIALQAAQQGQLAKFLGNHFHLGADVAEAQAPIPHGIGQAAVDAVHATRHLHPGQHFQQPPVGDSLHLRPRLGRRRQLAGSVRPQARLMLLNLTTASRIDWICHEVLPSTLCELQMNGLRLVPADLDALEDAECVRDEDRRGEVGADEVGHDRLLVDAHEPDIQAGLDLIRDLPRVQADDALVVRSRAHQQDGAGAAVADGDLVAGHDGDAAPSRNHVAVHLDAGGVDAPAAALLAEGRDGARVGQEERGILPHGGQQLIHVIRGRRPAAGVDALLEIGVVQEPELAVVDQLVLLALLQRLDGQPELLLGLIHRVVEQIGDAGVDLQHRLGHAQLILPRRRLVIDEGARQDGLALVTRGQLDGGLA
ncbi:hypothetical protein STIAU_8786 [Stigmatella aurantiaca DW4/3-1]|uniref:Uncharacterized protein n=1 Tax=Stigmatella aurantiaca (strain DW4/3-1) TaxID=378806 RepID=Q09A22_STIAD|nr:hypothetical protein STIAU_8786 [Stigmatella aurantiaca DW4/3-1]